MAKKKKSPRKEKLEKIEKRLEKVGRELSKIEKDLKKARSEKSTLVDEDMEKSRFVASVNKGETTVERPLPEYKGVKLFYRKFVSKLRKALGKE